MFTGKKPPRRKISAAGGLIFGVLQEMASGPFGPALLMAFSAVLDFRSEFPFWISKRALDICGQAFVR
jgi:hypothetical protein